MHRYIFANITRASEDILVKNARVLPASSPDLPERCLSFPIRIASSSSDRFLPSMTSPRTFVLTLCSGAAAVFVSLPLHADTVTLGASQDNSVFQNNVNNSNGGGPGIFAGTNGNASPRRGLIEFNVAGGVPSGATITAVTLQLTVGQLGGGSTMGRTIDLFDLSRAWGEGTAGQSTAIGGTGQGATAGTDDATWSANQYNVSTWTTAGGDHAATASATTAMTTVSLNSVFSWSSTALVTDVQGWLTAPSTNNGWEVISENEATSQSLLGFYSREGMQVSGVTASQLPQLTISYTVPEPAPGALLLVGTAALGLGAAMRHRRRA